MKNATTEKRLDTDNNRTTVLLRLLGTLTLYLCFGLLAEYAYANQVKTNPLDATQGTIWLQTDNGSYINALLLQTEVDFDVSGMIARAIVKQRFKNTSDLWAEGIYVFPLPENAAVDQLRLRIGQRLIEGQIQERTRAREIYDTAKKDGVRAGLVEQQRANVFTTSLANIAPGEEISVEIEYQQTLEFKDGHYRLRFPMVVGPRFQAANHLNPELSDDTDVSTQVSATPVNPVYLHLSLDAGVPLAALDSTYHSIDVKQTDLHRYSIALAPGEVYANRDFELVWRPELSQQPHTVVFTELHDDYEYTYLSVLPPDLQSLGQQILPRDVVFILDVSGSMSGTSIAQARASLVQALARLKPDDRFNIIWFNDRTERLFPHAIPANNSNIQHASKIINNLEADGGTVMLPALALALNEQAEPSRVRQIIFLTDGNVDNEQELYSLIDKQLGDNRLFTVGIGSAPNSYFMRMAARAGRGTFTHIGDVNEVTQKISMLLTKLETPALVNIDIKMEGMDMEAYPDPIPDLYLGEPVTVLIRGRHRGSNITIFGDYGESTWEQTLVISDKNPHPGVSRTWARNKIASLMEQHHGADTEQARDAIRNLIVQTSIAHRLVSRYTSLVAVDVTPVNSSGLLYSEKLKTHRPHGWKQGQNKHPANPQLLVAQLNLPQTATAASMHMMIASMLFALAMVFYLWKKML